MPSTNQTEIQKGHHTAKKMYEYFRHFIVSVFYILIKNSKYDSYFYFAYLCSWTDNSFIFWKRQEELSAPFVQYNGKRTKFNVCNWYFTKTKYMSSNMHTLWIWKSNCKQKFYLENFVRVIRLKRCAICKKLLRNDFLPLVFSHVSSRIKLKDREVLFILAISLLSRIVRIDDSWSWF